MRAGECHESGVVDRDAAGSGFVQSACGSVVGQYMDGDAGREFDEPPGGPAVRPRSTHTLANQEQYITVAQCSATLLEEREVSRRCGENVQCHGCITP